MHLKLENIQVFVPLAHIYVCLCILYTQHIHYIYVIYILYRLYMCVIYICCTCYNSKIAKSVISVGLMFIWLEEYTSNSTIFQERAVIYVHRVRKRFINSEHRWRNGSSKKYEHLFLLSRPYPLQCCSQTKT